GGEAGGDPLDGAAPGASSGTNPNPPERAIPPGRKPAPGPFGRTAFPVDTGLATLVAMPLIPLERLREAASRLAGKVHRTPLLSSEQIGSRIGACLYLKCESLQKTGSFKPRGALNKILSLPE